MCTNIKALLCDIEDSFNAGHLFQYSDTEIELLITAEQRCIKHHSYICVSMHVYDLLLLYSERPEQGKAYYYTVECSKGRSSSAQCTSIAIGCIAY